MNNIDHPPHYNQGSIEVITVIEDWKLGFCLGNCVKYIARSSHKNNEIEDLKKAHWYLTRQIDFLEKQILENQADKIEEYKCSMCGFKTWEKAKLDLHIDHHRRMTELESRIPVYPDEEKERS